MIILLPNKKGKFMNTKELRKHIKRLEAILSELEPRGFVYEILKIQLELYKQELKKNG